MFFDSWFGLLRVVVVGTSAYLFLLLILRASGKRVLSKLNAFDLVVTVSLGSTLSSILVTRSVALVEGVLALSLLVVLQFAVTWLSVRSKRFGRLVKAQPTLLYFRGEYLKDAMRHERVTEGEIVSAMRAAHFASPDAVEAVVLESAGELHVIARSSGNAGTLHGVEGASASASDNRK